MTLILSFLFNVIGPLPVYAQALHLPQPGVMVRLSPEYKPALLKGLRIDAENPFKFDFILETGDGAASKDEANKLIKYFLASLTVPEKDLWVNLSPYEKDRIIPGDFGLTEMGRDLLAQDYLLKQITASMIYPEDELGQKFWSKIYQEAAKKLNTTQIPVNTFNKVWIVPEKAEVFENAKAGTAYVVESKLKVMLEEDYLASSKVRNNSFRQSSIGEISPSQRLGGQIIREIVIPELTKEVNEGKNFARLRQIYHSLILAMWYKKKIKGSILSKMYSDKNKIAGVTFEDEQNKERIYQQYLAAFKKGVYNFIKEEQDPISKQMIPRKYFSGGFTATTFYDMAMTITTSPNFLNNILIQDAMQLSVKFEPAPKTGINLENRAYIDTVWYKSGHVGTYHGLEHSEMTGLVFRVLINALAQEEGSEFDGKDVDPLGQIADLHDYEVREKGSQAHVPATLRHLADDWAGNKSLEGKEGESFLRDKLKWTRLTYLTARAVIGRSEFPFGRTHPNKKEYGDKGTSPLEEYKKTLREINQLDPSGKALSKVMRIAHFFTIIDQANGYMRKDFQGAKAMVLALAQELRKETKSESPSDDFMLKNSFAFLWNVGSKDSYAIDLEIIKELRSEGIMVENVQFMTRNEIFRYLPFDYKANFERALVGFLKEKYPDVTPEQVEEFLRIGPLAEQQFGLGGKAQDHAQMVDNISMFLGSQTYPIQNTLDNNAPKPLKEINLSQVLQDWIIGVPIRNPQIEKNIKLKVFGKGQTIKDEKAWISAFKMILLAIYKQAIFNHTDKPISLNFEAKTVGNTVVLNIEDNQNGISYENIRSLVDRLAKGKNLYAQQPNISDDQLGSGLGLDAIFYGVENLNLTLVVENRTKNPNGKGIDIVDIVRTKKDFKVKSSKDMINSATGTKYSLIFTINQQDFAMSNKAFDWNSLTPFERLKAMPDAVLNLRLVALFEGLAIDHNRVVPEQRTDDDRLHIAKIHHRFDGDKRLVVEFENAKGQSLKYLSRRSNMPERIYFKVGFNGPVVNAIIGYALPFTREGRKECLRRTLVFLKELDVDVVELEFLPSDTGRVDGNRIFLESLVREWAELGWIHKKRTGTYQIDNHRSALRIYLNETRFESGEKAMVSPTGGIDLTSDKALLVANSGEEIKFKIDPAMMERFQNAPGLTPVIINIQPLSDLRLFLGLSDQPQATTTL